MAGGTPMLLEADQNLEDLAQPHALVMQLDPQEESQSQAQVQNLQKKVAEELKRSRILCVFCIFLYFYHI